MARSFLKASVILAGVFLSAASGFAQDEEPATEREKAARKLEERGKTGALNYFLGDTHQATGINVSLGIELYNQAVEFYQKREYELAREALQDALAYDSKNPFAYELRGDIAYFEQRLEEALKDYESAFRLNARQDLREKIVKVQQEKEMEAGLATDREEHFLIKYRGEEQGFGGFELREFLRSAYRSVGQDLGYFFKHKVVVLLYDEEEFRKLHNVPHWSGGLYDGKIRLPAYQKGFSEKEIQKVMRHELTHAFVVEMSRGKCPAWLNEGLAEYEESKVEAPDLRVFEAAVRTNTLFPISDFFSRERLLEIKDPLEAQLFYVQAYQFVKYWVDRFGMFSVKKMLDQFAQGKDSFDGIQEVLKMSPLELEKRWREDLQARN